MQKNWIGRSQGLKIRFEFDSDVPQENATLEVFTTRPDTLFGASFMALSPEHPLTTLLAAENENLRAFVEDCRSLGTSMAEIETAEKKGIDTGLTVKHPFVEGKTLPVYVANFVLMDYGTGAIFGCPAHDQRDIDFARKYGLEVTPVVLPPDQLEAAFYIQDEAYIGEGSIINSDFLNGLSIDEAKNIVAERLEARMVEGAPKVSGRSIIACATGAFRDNAIGAVRYRLFTARLAVLCRFPTPSCRWYCLMMLILTTGKSARPPPHLA